MVRDAQQRWKVSHAAEVSPHVFWWRHVHLALKPVFKPQIVCLLGKVLLAESLKERRRYVEALYIDVTTVTVVAVAASFAHCEADDHAL